MEERVLQNLSPASTYQVDDLPEPDLDAAEVELLHAFGVVNELAELGLAHLCGLEAKDKEHRVDSIRLAGSIRSDDG